jgi:hypothetical protein
MRIARFTAALAPWMTLAGLALTVSPLAGAAEKCGGAAIANGPFTYAPSDAGSATFIGAAGAAQSTGFSITAPSASAPNWLPVVFPGQGQNTCLGQADASVGVFDVTQIADADGDLLETPVELESGSSLYGKIAAAFDFNPWSNTFTPGSSVNVGVTVSNPVVGDAEFGHYEVKMAAQAPGAGIGVGPGSRYTLVLKAATLTDTTPPTVTISEPAADATLGVIPIALSAVDPAPGSGLASVAARVSSAGGAVSNLVLPLSLDSSLPAGAGLTVGATGSFTPHGGTGLAGTTDAFAFNAGSLSGIGRYTLTADATDVAGNTGTASRSFKVGYAVSFDKQSTQNGCDTKTGNPGKACHGMFHFTVHRSSSTSDGAFMVDQTVVVKLVRVSDQAVVASHGFSVAGSPNTFVKIATADQLYQTHFVRGDLGVTVPATYVAEVYFRDVDGVEMLQAKSVELKF